MAELTPQETAQETAQETVKPGRPPLLAIVLLIAVLLLALYIGTNVLSVLFAVVSPPLPPLPPNLTQTSHTSEAYGVDQWKYVTTGDACTLVKYVQDNGGDCRIVPLGCGENRAVSPNLHVENTIVARCDGKMNFSIFNEQWWSLITLTKDGSPQIEVNREVYWLGTGPQ
ncbi:MAG: hypothetical protein ABI835_17475 [Chloroflexota bacterium]